MDVLLKRLVRTGFARGRSGSQAWVVVAVFAFGLRALRRLANPAPEILYRTEVKTGDRFEIATRRG